jgi:hypothetical protein
LLIVLALAGDSTTTIFIEFQVVGDEFRVGSEPIGRSDSDRTWVTRSVLSNREGRVGAFWRRDFPGESRDFQYNLKEIIEKTLAKIYVSPRRDGGRLDVP